ncbi:MAG TPA: hypothetical protein PLZ77_00225 [Lachnospiraceae bacterium]|nr:hypothetical protein [Lachnospiraceae bacterium]HPF28510.1 hypothetical protein [Lachnospiraceae bacterium]
MKLDPAIIELDLHGLRTQEAIAKIEKAVEQAGRGTYRIRLIHGYHGGTRIKEAIVEEFSYGRNDRVKRIVPGSNEGITELILRD